MDIEYRRLTEKDLDTFIQMRIGQLQEEGTEVTCNLDPPLRDYYMRHLTDGTFVSWLAVDMDQEEIIGTSGMSFVEKPPYYGCISGKIGLLSSMYVKEVYRRQGIAKTLLVKIMSEAKEYGCKTVQITASDMGILLYKEFGFKNNPNFMYYTF